MKASFTWEDFVNVCCDRGGRFNLKVRGLAVEPDPDRSVSDSKAFARLVDDLENRGEKIHLEGGLF